MSNHGNYYFRATTVTTEQDGSVHFRDSHGIQNLIIPSGKWKAVNAASIVDGGIIGVEHWGEFHKAAQSEAL